MQGQADQKKTITLSSQILLARWQSDEVSEGGKALLLIDTLHVADASSLTISLVDRSGKNAGSLKGKIKDNRCQIQVPVPKGCRDCLFAMVELSSHKLKLSSAPLRLIPQIRFSEAQIWDAEGSKKLAYFQDRESCKLKAKVAGAPDSCWVNWSVELVMEECHSSVVKTGRSLVKQGQFEQDFQWNFGSRNLQLMSQNERKMHGDKYENPSLSFRVSAYGVEMQSPIIPIRQSMILRYVVANATAGYFENRTLYVTDPHGQKSSYKIPANGDVVVEQTLPGIYVVDDHEVMNPA